MSAAPVVHIQDRGDVAVIVVDNPPVNALSHGVRSGILDALKAVETGSSIRAVVIACAGKTFIAGADIREFGAPPRSPTLP